jgi:hypothetical protein
LRPNPAADGCSPLDDYAEAILALVEDQDDRTLE